MNKRLLLLWISALFLLAGTALAACGDDDDDDGGGGGGGDTGAAEVDTLKPGTLTLGSDIPYPPFESGRAPDYDGFDIDLANEIATRLDLELEVKDTPFDTIFRDLAQGKFDIVASATTITGEREQTVDFSDPYYNAEQNILVQESSDIQTVEDLAGQTVGAQKGTTGEAYAKDQTDADTVRSYAEIDDAFNALIAGQVDAVVNDLPVNQDAAENKEGLKLGDSIPTDESYGMAFQEDADALREAVNEVLAEIKEDGTYERIYREYFKKAPPQAVLDATHTPK
jgi:polar amino acid transport system substrate-binding protein